MKPNAIVILSGGLDSTVLTYFIKNLNYNPYAITFNYGAKHNRKEIICAMKTCKLLGIPHKLITIPLDSLFTSSSLLVSNKHDIPKEDYSVDNQKQTVVPNRNMILLALAVGVAEDMGISTVFYGAHKNDYAIYPDCRPEFVEYLSKASKKGTYHKVEIVAPFVHKTKAEIVKEGINLSVPFQNTWSCYVGGGSPCGSCGTCREREKAFEEAGVEDTLMKK